MFDLPLHVWGIIREFIGQIEFNEILLNCFQKSHPWLLYEFLTMQLGVTLSSRYLENAQYRLRINRQIRYPYKNIFLNVSGVYPLDFSKLCGFHRLDVSNCHELDDHIFRKYLGQEARVLHVSGTRVTDISSLNRHKIKYIDISYTAVQDVSIMEESFGLSALDCSKLVEVNCLKNLQYVDLRFCENVSDVSALGNVPTLLLGFCSGIQTWFSESQNRIIDISYTTIQNVDMFANAKIVDMSGCFFVNDISKLHNVIYLKVENCFNLCGIRFLYSVKKVSYENPVSTFAFRIDYYLYRIRHFLYVHLFSFE